MSPRSVNSESPCHFAEMTQWFALLPNNILAPHYARTVGSESRMLSSHPKSNSGISPKLCFGAFSMSPHSENSEPLLARAVGKKHKIPCPKLNIYNFLRLFANKLFDKSVILVYNICTSIEFYPKGVEYVSDRRSAVLRHQRRVPRQ
jgi:hypothetical protein